MLEGESGILAVTPPEEIRSYEPSKRQLVWMNGSRIDWFSAEEPDALRGPQFHFAWGDEVARWIDGPKVWMNLRLALRRGSRPRAVLTTTPRPVPLIRALLADPKVMVTRGRTVDNAAHLPPNFIAAVTEAYGGTRLGRQELDGELIEDVEGALWTRDGIEACRVAPSPRSPFGESPSPCEGEGLGAPSPHRGEGDCAVAQRGEGAQWRRVVVGVDPPATTGGDACGIIVVALGQDGRGHVLADCSVRGRSPEGWARAVVAAADVYGADRVIAETNNGGDMVVSVLRSVEANLPVRKVHAARGKVARAEPVASLYAGGRVVHHGAFPQLEDEMCGMVAGGTYAGPGRSPDRADALVWALTELMLGVAARGPRVRMI
jgi:phage terminase large subunit-like protein